MSKKGWIFTYLSLWRVIILWFVFKRNKFKEKCQKDLDAWIVANPALSGKKRFLQFAYLAVNFKSNINIILNRLHRNPIKYVIARILFSPCKELYINMPPENIGGGLYFQHGFSTIVTAKKIGERCRIFQQVTIGYRGEDAPIIGNDVSVSAGAIVIGDVVLEDNCVVGAGAVVTRDVPKNATVVGVPAKVIKTEKN